MGLQNIIETIEIKNKKIYLYTDSKYLINSITLWYKKWEQNNWKTSTGKSIKNLNLIKKLYYYSKNLKVKFFHVNSHQKKPDEKSKEYKIWFGNDQADKLAKNARNKN